MERKPGENSNLEQARRPYGGLEAHKKLIDEMMQPKVFVGNEARTAQSALGAQAFATGQNVSFGSQSTAHEAAHEATHVVQQQRND